MKYYTKEVNKTPMSLNGKELYTIEYVKKEASELLFDILIEHKNFSFISPFEITFKVVDVNKVKML